MIKRKNVSKSDQVKVSFVLAGDDPRLPASVVGDFNDWDASAHPLKARRNETYSAVVTLAKGGRYAYRYRSEDGTWFNEDQADDYQRDDHGNLNCVLIT
jgi:1,4-alpha-glucan branching enzyme